MNWSKYQTAYILIAVFFFAFFLFSLYILRKTYKQLRFSDAFMLGIVVFQSLSCLVGTLFAVFNLLSTIYKDQDEFIQYGFVESLQLWTVTFLASTYFIDMAKWWQFILFISTSYTASTNLKQRLRILNWVVAVVISAAFLVAFTISVIEDYITDEEESDRLVQIQSMFSIGMYSAMAVLIIITMIVLIQQLQRKQPQFHQKHRCRLLFTLNFILVSCLFRIGSLVLYLIDSIMEKFDQSLEDNTYLYPICQIIIFILGYALPYAAISYSVLYSLSQPQTLYLRKENNETTLKDSFFDDTTSSQNNVLTEQTSMRAEVMYMTGKFGLQPLQPMQRNTSNSSRRTTTNMLGHRYSNNTLQSDEQW